MMDAMLDKLNTLEQTLRDVRKNYHITLTELNTLKAKDRSNPAELNQLKLDFVQVKNHHAKLVTERDELNNKLNALDKRYQTLAEAHHLIGEEQDRLQQKIEELQKNNKNLQEKNRIAAEHTKVVLQRLTQIDQASN